MNFSIPRQICRRTLSTSLHGRIVAEYQTCNPTHRVYNTGNRITHFTLPAKLQFQYSITKTSIGSNSFHILKSAPTREFSAPNSSSNNENNVNDKLLAILNRLLDFIRSVIPSGSWWNLDLYVPDINSTVTAATSITVLRALSRIWTLVADDRWVVYIAFVSLTIAALSEISMPSLLARCIFSAQSDETLVFTGYILFQQRSSWGFSKQAWGRLSTSFTCNWTRFTFDIAQHASGDRCISQFADFILASCIIDSMICCILSAMFLVFGQYQKKAARITQDFTACANEVVLQETLSSVRTVRVYGTETKEHARYKQLLDKLAFISMRESAAYGFWNLSFSTPYRLTQVLAIIVGGISLLTGHASAEQLTKYVLY